MEYEINKIKQDYNSILPTEFLSEKGIDDLWSRIDTPKNHSYLFYGKFIFAGFLLIILASTSLIAIANTNAKPGSKLYSVKILTDKATGLIINNKTEEKIKDSKIIKPEAKRANSPTPSPIVKDQNKINENSSLKRNEVKELNNQSNFKTEKSNSSIKVKEEVKGVKAIDNSSNNNSENEQQNSKKENNPKSSQSENPGKGNDISENHKKEK